MAKKIRTRRVRSDDGDTVEICQVTCGGQVVDDDRNGFKILGADGRVAQTLPVSADAMRRTARWFAGESNS